MPSPNVDVLPAAQIDIDEQTDFLAVHDSAAVAEHFLTDLRAVFTRLIRFPRIGRPWPTRVPEIRHVRRFKLSNFPVSVFYRSTDRGIEIVRVLHHARHLPPDLDDEP